MMACFIKVMVFVCLINLVMILCISFVTGNEVNDNDPPLPDLKLTTDITVSTNYGKDILEPNLEGLYDVLINVKYIVTFTVENNGEANAKNVTVNFKIVYYDVYDYEIKEHEDNSTIAEIIAGNNGTIDFYWSPEQYATLYTVMATVDPDNSIPELHDHYTKLESELFKTNEKEEEHNTHGGWLSLRFPFINTFCQPWLPFLIVICSLLIYFIFRWRKSKSKQ